MIELPAVVVALTAFMGTPALPPAAELISLAEPRTEDHVVLSDLIPPWIRAMRLPVRVTGIHG